MIKEMIDRVRKGPKFKYRDAGTGRYVTWLFAKLHPGTTVRERVR